MFRFRQVRQDVDAMALSVYRVLEKTTAFTIVELGTQSPYY